MNANTVNDSVMKVALQRKGYEVTSQRTAICRFALSSREHPTASGVFTAVRSANLKVSLATVYNTLRILKELNLVQELTLMGGEKRYDSYLKPHLHLVCLQCGEISDVKARSCYETASRAAAKARFTVTQHRFELYGICGKCKRSNNLASK